MEHREWFTGDFDYPNAKIVDEGGRPVLVVSDQRTSPEEFRAYVKAIVREHNAFPAIHKSLRLIVGLLEHPGSFVQTHDLKTAHDALAGGGE